jgi:membrane-associated HD superfamily phosphohydrolase
MAKYRAKETEILVYTFWILSFLFTLVFPIIYVPFIFCILAVYFAEKIKKENRKRGNLLTLISIVILIIELLFTIFAWSSWLLLSIILGVR